MTNELTRVTEAAHKAFDEEQLDLIRRSVAPEADDSTFLWFASVAARYDLNPMTQELYLAQMPGRDGAPPRFTLIVGKHGMVRIADRHSDYRGCDSDFVCERDTFAVDHTEDGPKVTHKWNTQKANPGDESARGNVIGAWAIAYRNGRRPVFVYTPISEYRQERNRAWKNHTTAMIRKCAVANALREQFSLSGLYDEAEMARVLAQPADAIEVVMDWGEDQELAIRLQALVERANEVDPGCYREAKVRTILAGGPERRQQFAEELERHITEHGGELPDIPEQPVDAVVVEDDGTTEDAEVVAEAVDGPSGIPHDDPPPSEPEADLDGEAESQEDLEPEGIEDATPVDAEAERAQLQHDLADIEAALENAESDAEREELLARANELEALLNSEQMTL